jgi:hypothetical protein
MRQVRLDQSQALAFVDALAKSPRTRIYLQACLGYDGVPDVKDFLVSDPASCERAEELIGHLYRTVETLQEVHRQRPRQTEINLEPDPLPEEEAKVDYPRGGVKSAPRRKAKKARVDIDGRDE